METLSKLYLELANIVPPECMSSREHRLQRHIDQYGVALMMIAEGAIDPVNIARKALQRMGESA